MTVIYPQITFVIQRRRVDDDFARTFPKTFIMCTAAYLSITIFNRYLSLSLSVYLFYSVFVLVLVVYQQPTAQKDLHPIAITQHDQVEQGNVILLALMPPTYNLTNTPILRCISNN